MEGDRTKLVIILGPTASGKSELAVRLAERLDGEIVNADSMQVYRGMDIGTAKPSPELCRRVPHHLLDVVEPDVNFSAADFQAAASRVIGEIQGRGKRVFVVGGTGLYIKSLLQGLVDSPRADESLRAELESLAGIEGKEVFHRRLAEVDPVTAARLHPNDRVRIVRALEVFMMTGRPISSYRDEHGFSGDYYDCHKIGLSVEREELYRRVEERVDRMMAGGLVEEVRRLLAAGYDRSLKSMRSIGYKEVCAYLAGECTLEDAVSLVKRDTRHYAKRQLTWFRKDSEINWVEYPGKFDSIFTDVIEFFD